ncbi:LysR family transcriptional regulator [Vibrio europaeus]|uniref:LysR family transcriptional regulator n=1 Tax=Vibrio europaeus TaxID=300876 RepID=UPI00233F6B8C|nr:LysR family transcriptional regulator [Vibrio europaeus]MDC5721779.1 LysR family transcriptional regulator [Vibrio europaeus]MDC5758169.1 LysR family transcriptional regulator [Vibrio europaeus]MDC5776446.1 LysR family transcriptional regulator [Vibrio europaeus]MDC5795695.1 LysR family transcriptional regulator [Vibrio europaeus]MDC5801638.1 LysR family transcriptional regulator [Vibrio europaeus]
MNLLKILRAVVETKSVSCSAMVLGVSRTSISRGIVKLREHFGPQFIVRRSHGLEPSGLAIQLAQASVDILIPLEKVLDAYLDFEQEEYSGTINILVNTFLLEFFGPELVIQLKESFPNATFNLSQWQKDSLSEALKGKIDYVIQLESYQFPQEFHRRSLARLENFIIARNKHPILSQGSDWERIHALPIVRLFLDGINPNKGILENLYEQRGYTANFILTTHSIRAAVALVKNSDAILYASRYVSASDPEISEYALPPTPENLNLLDINGLYLHRRDGNPLVQAIHQCVQTFFDASTLLNGACDEK